MTQEIQQEQNNTHEPEVKAELPPKRANKYMFYGLISIIQISITFLVCQSYVDRTNGRLVDYIEQEISGKPTIRVLDLKGLTKQLLGKGLTPAETAEYGDLYIQSLNEQGFLVLDASSIIAYKEGLTRPLPEFQEVKAVADKLGIKAKQDYQELLDNSALSKLYEQLNTPQGTTNGY
jgi:hypothetical protein